MFMTCYMIMHQFNSEYVIDLPSKLTTETEPEEILPLRSK